MASEIIEISKDNPQFLERCKSLANRIESGEFEITELVTDLSSLLTSSLTNDREKGITILSSILTYIPEDTLNEAQLRYICNFYSEKLDDNHQVIPAVIQGLKPLISSKNIPDGSATQLFRSLLQYVPCQQQQYSDRINIYNFIKTLLDKRKAEIESIGIDLVYGVISIIDGERDPRNLLLLFNWLPTFLKSRELGHLTEEMFEVMSCYFPVDFRAPTNDENFITRDILASALCPCLCVVPNFADLCISLALEKLTSELHIAKLDSLDLLVEGCKNFPTDIYKQHFTTIWSCIQKEVFTSNDKHLIEKCLMTLTCTFKKVSVDAEFLNQMILDMFDTLKGNLRPDATLFVSSLKLLKAAAHVSLQCAELIFKKTSSILVNLFNITNTPPHKASILDELINFAIIYLVKGDSEISIETNELNLVPTICLKAMTSTDRDVKNSGIYGFLQLAQFLPLSIRNYVYQNLSVLILVEQDSLTFKLLMTCLKVFAELYPTEVQDVMVNIQTNGLESHKPYLQAIGAIASVKELKLFSLSVLIDSIFKQFDTSIIATEILYVKIEEDELFLIENSVNVVDIIDNIINYLLKNINNFNLKLHENFLCNIAKILNVTFRNLEINIQNFILERQLQKIESVSNSEVNVIIYFGILTSLRSNINLPIKIIDEILEITLNSKFAYISLIGCEILANIVNKTNDEEILITLSHIELKCGNQLQPIQENILTVMSFTTKALVLRNHPSYNIWIKKLLQISAVNLKATQSFGIILNDNFDCLNPKSFCNRKMLYKQRFFSEITTYLVDNYNEDNKCFLAILGYMLPHISQQILQTELKKIIRLVLLCLGYCEESSVLEAVLSSINTIIENKEQIAVDYIQEFLKYYLKLTLFDKSMKVRVLALKGIQLYSTYPMYKVLPLKQDTLMHLSKCLDDKKRLVRKEAVETRSLWFLIDAPI